MTAPKIFTVHVFKTVDGDRLLDVHYVAATSSAEAQARIASSHAEHLVGQCFITTDELEDTYGQCGVKTYVTSYRSGGPITDEEFAHWQRSMTRVCDRPDWIAPFPGREHHQDWCSAVVHPDARLIAASPKMLQALKTARDCILVDRTALADCHTAPDGSVDEDGASGLAEYDAALAEINAAIAEAEGS